MARPTRDLTDETKEERFDRIAQERMIPAIKRIRMLEPLTNARRYGFTTPKAMMMLATLREEIDKIERGFFPPEKISTPGEGINFNFDGLIDFDASTSQEGTTEEQLPPDEPVGQSNGPDNSGPAPSQTSPGERVGIDPPAPRDTGHENYPAGPDD